MAGGEDEAEWTAETRNRGMGGGRRLGRCLEGVSEGVWQVFGGCLAGLRPTSGYPSEVGREAEVAEAH